MTNIYGIYSNNPSARAIINSKIRNAERDRNKYNVSLIRSVEDSTGVTASDYREGSDTGVEQEKHY